MSWTLRQHCIRRRSIPIFSQVALCTDSHPVCPGETQPRDWLRYKEQSKAMPPTEWEEIYHILCFDRLMCARPRLLWNTKLLGRSMPANISSSCLQSNEY